MRFWGVEVKCGEPLKVRAGNRKIVHISQAVLGETNKGKGTERVSLSVNVDKQKFVFGTLSADKLPQAQFDLVFEKDFELSHNWKHGSVYFHGYKAHNPFDEEIDSDFDSDEEMPTTLANNGKQAAKPKEEKPVEVEKSNAAKKKESGSGKQKVTIVEPTKVVSSDEDDDSDDDLSLSEDSGEDDSGDESDDSDGSDESEEETPQKVEVSKKRAAESASKTPVADKKAKVTPQKTDGKKVSGHVATPHPAKGKTPGSKPSQQTPKSAGTPTCSSCNKGFGSDKALESHNKAKHGGS